MDPANWRTYLVTQESRSTGRPTTEIVDAAIAGGIDAVQLREKHTSVRERYELGRRVREQTAEAGVPLIVNDRVDLAAVIDADGVHLGQSDLPVTAARDLLGPDALVGCSAATVTEARTAVADGADYLGVGSVYPTDSKAVPDEEQGIGTDRVGAIADAVPVPVIGIGGITPANAGAVTAAGAAGVAVMSAITAAEGPRAATAALREAVADA
ncbi:MAG: thiamine phosphate synthase [Halovenus sp.]